TRQIRREAAAVYLCADPRAQGRLQVLTKQVVQLGELERRHRGCQVDDRPIEVRQLALVGRPRPAALFADGPGEIQQGVGEAPLGLQAFGQRQAPQLLAPTADRLFVALSLAVARELEIERRRQLFEWLLRGSFGPIDDLLDLAVTETLPDRAPGRPIIGRGNRRRWRRRAERLLNDYNVVATQHPWLQITLWRQTGAHRWLSFLRARKKVAILAR